jgi:ATP-binding protein involved in chromosome partitioning
MSTIDAINAALATVIDPELHKPLPELGMVDSVDFKSGVATPKYPTYYFWLSHEG